MKETLTSITMKLYEEDWKKMAELYGKNRAEEVRKAIKKLIKIAEEKQEENLT